MQEYLQKTQLSAVMDEIGALIALLAGSLGLYLLLWGLRPMSVLAGISTFTLCALLRAQTRERRLRRREKRLRGRIGGEMRLEAWTTCAPAKAHYETAALLRGLYPLEIRRATASGAVCSLSSQSGEALVACAQLHRSEQLSARDVAAFQRACLAVGAQKGCLCGAAASAAAREQAALHPSVTLIGREAMIALAGAEYPATDRQLVELGRRFAGRHSLRSLKAALVEGGRAKKFLLYALLLLSLFFLSGQRIYALFGTACLLLMAVCRITAGKHAETLLS